MLDNVGTILGFIIGLFLIFFGIIWPDHLSNYYIYQMQEYETQLTEMKKVGTPLVRIEALEKEMEDFQTSTLGNLARFTDLKSIAIVLGGTFAATLIAFPFSKAFRAFLFIVQAFGQNKTTEEFLYYYRTLLRFAEKRVQNELIPDEEIEAIEDDNLKSWLQSFIVIDVIEEQMIEEIIRSEIEMYDRRTTEEIDVVEFMGKVAPAFGMIGTVVGLILMLGKVTDADTNILSIMAAMGVAMITTLYGVLLANLVFFPVAVKRTQLKDSHLILMEMGREGILYLKRRELPEVMSQDLIIYLPTSIRSEIEEEKRVAIASGDLGL